ncbi:MAG: hypothetical protein P4M15_10455 [Alphaproteobacteria bacterium]|nr:hypothetical protein [Alphaproteobacteria bacterium]
MKASEILALWVQENDWSTIILEDCDTLENMSAAEARKYVDISGDFGESCSFIINTEAIYSNSRPKITSIYLSCQVNNMSVCLLKLDGGLRINVRGGDNKVFVGRVGHVFNGDINIWGNSRAIISDGSTCNYARMILHNSSVVIGYDSMLSDEIIIQSAD